MQKERKKHSKNFTMPSQFKHYIVTSSSQTHVLASVNSYLKKPTHMYYLVKDCQIIINSSSPSLRDCQIRLRLTGLPRPMVNPLVPSGILGPFVAVFGDEDPCKPRLGDIGPRLSPIPIPKLRSPPPTTQLLGDRPLPFPLPFPHSPPRVFSSP